MDQNQTDKHDQFSAQSNEKPGFAHQAAKTCLISPVIVFALLVFSKSVVSKATLDLCALALILIGLVFGIVALFGMKKTGRQKILFSSLAGMTANGLLLFIFITNFMAARSKAIDQDVSPVGNSNGKVPVAVAMKSFKKDGIAFQFDERYELKESQQKHQIYLKHPYSNVVITDYRERLDPMDSLEKYVSAFKANFENNHYDDIFQSNIEPVNLAGFSGFKASLEYTRPGNLRIVTDLCVVLSGKDSYSILHFYQKNQSSIATSLFNPVLNSFAEIEPTNQLNVLPNDN